MNILFVLFLLATLGPTSVPTQQECRQLDYPLELKRPGRSICAEHWPAGAAQRFSLSVMDQGQKRVVWEPLELESDEVVDLDKLQVFDLKTETIVFMPVEKGAAGYRDEGYALLYFHDRMTDEFRRIKERWTCRRKCTLQFLSYMTSKDRTEFYYETRVDGQNMKSSYHWKGGRMIPLVIEEPKSADALRRGHEAPASTPVCERTKQVVAEIERRLKGKRCHQITEYDLSRVTLLSLSRKGVKKLLPGDFSGLPKLTSIELSHNPLDEIPPRLFDGLFLLRSLNFQGCKLSSLPGGVFSHLGSLKSLYLNHNRITQLPKNAFEGLSSLTFLSLNHNRLKALPKGLFDPLPKKHNVYLSNNPLSK